MEINFCYINGISRENTPYFSTLSDQISYFTSLNATKVITNTFYPPYYRNNIKVDIADIDLESNFNYCFFEYKQKYYYYFISNVSYISEDVLSISITMDTIQTYFFDISVHSAVIRRKFIDRYDSLGNISRSYIRENVSLNIRELVHRKDYTSSVDFSLTPNTSDPIKGYYIIAFSTYPGKSEADKAKIYKNCIKIYDKKATSPYIYGIIPDYNFFDTSIIHLAGDTGEVLWTINPAQSLSYWSSHAEVYKVYYVPLNIFTSYVSVNENQLYFARGFFSTLMVGENNATMLLLDTDASKPLLDVQTKDNYLRDRYDFGFNKNVSKSATFSKFNVPALLDENYISILFGDNRASTTFPLHLLTSDFVLLDYRFDYDGHCYYNILPDASIINKYNTIVVTPTSETPAITNAYRDYLAYNKYSIIGALATTAIGVGASVLTMNPLPAIGAVSSAATTGISTITSTGSMATYSKGKTSYAGADMGDRRKKYNYKLAPWVGLNSGDYEPGTYSMPEGDTSDGISIPGSALHSFTALTSALTTKSNAMAAPNQPKGYGSSVQDICSYSNQPKLEISYVHDIDACAQYYHRYGYLVNEYINPTSHIFSDINTRYYFNYIELAECDIDLSCLQFDSCTSDIASRFYSGIRLWNPIITKTSSGTSITYDIGNYTYDNVERSALNG